MKALQISYLDISGGAARAAYRIHHALRANGVDSAMYSSIATSRDWTVQSPGGAIANFSAKARVHLAKLATRTLKTGNPITHSPAIVPSGMSERFNQSQADVLNLHWINGEMMSVADIGRLSKPTVWTLHDMWAFCGAEHYTDDFRWREGYSSTNRPSHESGFDLNRWTWLRKRKHWLHPRYIVTPSTWLANCVGQSALMHDWPVSVIPNALDTDVWRPVDKIKARELTNLPLNAKLLLFGAPGGTSDNRKGFDLLQDALGYLKGKVAGIELVVLGERAPQVPINLGFPIHYTGHLYDDLSLRLYYSASDIVLVPSRQEAFGQAASEGHACGTPVVAFGATGLSDVIVHEKTGWLAESFCPTSFARGIQWVISDPLRHERLCAAAREHALCAFSYSVVAAKYRALYDQVIENTQANSNYGGNLT